MTDYYKVYKDKYTYCKLHPKHIPAEYGCPYIENKSKKKFKNKCECPINTTIESPDSIPSGFTLACGSCLKVFESDEPVEIGMEVQVEGVSGEDLCNLKVNVFLENGNVLEFDLPNPGPLLDFPNNIISFYSKNVRKVTLECESDSGIGCTGNLTFTFPIRELEGFCKCECPVNKLITSGPNIYLLECGNCLKIFESDEPVEMVTFVSLVSDQDQDTCDLNVIVELEDGSALKFHIPNPNIIPDNTGLNTISFYSKNVCKVTLECENGVGVGCAGIEIPNIVLRGSKIEML